APGKRNRSERVAADCSPVRTVQPGVEWLSRDLFGDDLQSLGIEIQEPQRPQPVHKQPRALEPHDRIGFALESSPRAGFVFSPASRRVLLRVGTLAVELYLAHFPARGSPILFLIRIGH